MAVVVYLEEDCFLSVDVAGADGMALWVGAVPLVLQWACWRAPVVGVPVLVALLPCTFGAVTLYYC